MPEDIFNQMKCCLSDNGHIVDIFKIFLKNKLHVFAKKKRNLKHF